MAELEFREIATLTRGDKARYAAGLAMAVMESTHLDRELPFVSRGYRNPVRGYRRLGLQAAKTPSLRAYIMTENGYTLGIASAETARPRPDVLGSDIPAMELSWWHGDIDRHAAISYGKQAVRHLGQLAKGSPYSSELLWIVSLPDDTNKQLVAQEMAFRPVGVPEVYQLGDAVQEPRQLWVRE